MREVTSRATSAKSLTSVVPSVLANVVDDGICAFSLVPTRIEPPNLTKTWNLRHPNLFALGVVQVVEEVVLV